MICFLKHSVNYQIGRKLNLRSWIIVRVLKDKNSLLKGNFKQL